LSLDRYREKRSAARTPEPMGGDGPARPGVFVVQKHAARRTHYDLRLEMGGVLKSWAVPKGPAPDPAEKRLAVETEDHPVEYADFEGLIPEGEYGGGAMIVWDRGRWVPKGDPAAGLAAGKLLFELSGYKLRGLWTLVRLKPRRKGDAGKEWLLMKERDAFAASSGGAPLGEESILSGFLVEDLASAPARAAEVREEAVRLGAPAREVDAAALEPMLAEVADEPFSAPGWVFEIKYDGFRLVAGRSGASARVFYRRGREATAAFPDVARAVAALPYRDLVLDGEVTVLDEAGRPSFERLQKRCQLLRPLDIERAAVDLPAAYFVFDLLGFEGRDLRPLPLRARKALLARILPKLGPLRYADHIEERGAEMFAAVLGMGLEGVVAKRADAPYRAGRSADWRKVRVERTADFAVVGFTRGGGSRAGFGALHLAVRDGRGWRYAGRVGSGFDGRELDEIGAALERDRRPAPVVAGAVPKSKSDVWVEPRMVVEVRYRDVTEAGLLRQPTFVRVRTDKAPENCAAPLPALLPPPPAGGGEAGGGGGEEAKGGGAALPFRRAAADERRRGLAGEGFANLEKVFFPADGITKGDLIAYYRAVAPWLLRYLRDRPVVLVRYPDGIEGKSFFQQNAPGYARGRVRTERLWNESAKKEIEHFVCEDEAGLLYLVNLGTIPLHIWASRLASIDAPDFCVLDLDPKGAPFGHVVEIARALKALCDEIGLPAFVKTSGSTGLHVMIPLGAQCGYVEARGLAELLARVVERELPAIATTERVIAARGGRVYLDHVQNGHGRLIAAPLCVRPLPGAPVSTPLAWDEVDARLEPRKFTIREVPDRLRDQGDPLAPVLERKPDLAAALGKLGERVRRMA
jgi:bifunctional non-homologous end joining protein LigD